MGARARCPSGTLPRLLLASLCRSLVEGASPGGAPGAERQALEEGLDLELGLPAHLQEARLTSVPGPPASIDDAREHLGRALRTARRIRGHFGLASLDAPPPPGERGLGLQAPLVEGRRAQPDLPQQARTVSALSFGADPTGERDSTDALQSALAELVDRGRAGSKAANGIADLGGAALDLAGGAYLISAPLVVPGHVGNLHLRQGTLRASPRFPSDRWLLTIGDPGCVSAARGSDESSEAAYCNQFVSVVDMLFDAAHVAAGGVHVANTMGSNIGPSVFFMGFKDAGVRVDGGRGVVVQEAWFAEYYWSEVRKGESEEKSKSTSSSVGVQLNGRDHVVRNAVVFSFAKVGVEVNGVGNVLQNVHTWNGGGDGIVVNAPQTRILGCYLDWNRLLITDPEQTLVQSTFFLETNLHLKASKKKWIDGLRLHDNTYVHWSQWREVNSSVELEGNFEGGVVEIKDEISRGIPLRVTQASRTLRRENATRWLFDFSDVLLFPWISEVMYSFASEGEGFVSHVARRPVGATVAIEADVPATATVTVEVAQGAHKFGKAAESSHAQ
mmetsp:Transcript_72844/g.193236  ORF Transcript_72844/g.193236 Transcript_72844/m.193236 type:complete len:559 (-) Transcript_72844:88-1764(-)